MTFKPHSIKVLAGIVLTWTSLASPLQSVSAQTAGSSAPIQFDMPAIVTAVDTSLPGTSREVTFDLSLSTLVVDPSSDTTPPVDHLLVRVQLRDRQPILDYAPKTELQTDFAGPIAISKKREQTDSFGLSADGAAHALGAVHLGIDDQSKQSDNTQFERHAPMQAVVASGTIDRGHGVYFKLRWTAQQVLEGEKFFRLSIAVPEMWRGGLVDVDVTANRNDAILFGSRKVRPVASKHFVVALCQSNDSEAAELALRLASLDQKLARMAQQLAKPSSNPITEFWSRVLPKADEVSSQWYPLVTTQQADPYTDKRIQSLPMPVRVAVLDYADASRELQSLTPAS